MTYIRVIPRDLFNESKLLKCLGKLVIEAERHPEIAIEQIGGDRAGFDIRQNEADGGLWARNIHVSISGVHITVQTAYNSKQDWPLYASNPAGDVVSVFNHDGSLTCEFLGLADAKA